MKDYYIFFSESFLEYPDNCSNAIVISISGCHHNCKGCHSPLTQKLIQENAEEYKKGMVEFEKYYKFSGSPLEVGRQIISIINKINNSDHKVVLTGGDCLQCHPELVAEIVNLLELGNQHEICIYTGLNSEEAEEVWEQYYRKEFITPIFQPLIFKCGSFKQDLYVSPEKTDEYIQLASTNQNFYDSEFNLLSKDGKLIFNN